MNFTCSGTIKKVMITGIKQDGDQRRPMKLHIWRLENSTEWGRYRRINNIELPSNVCEMNVLKKMMTFHRIGISEYGCTLKNMIQMPVEPGDILGIELPPKPKANFELYSVTESRPTNFIFERARELSSYTIDLCNRTNETTALPLVRVKVELSSTSGIFFKKLAIIAVHLHSCTL